MKRWLLLISFVLTLVLISCQNVSPIVGNSTIEGYAKFSDRDVHSGIKISIEGLETGGYSPIDTVEVLSEVTTEDDGKFVLKNIPAGYYIIKAKYEGYFTSSIFVDVKPESTVSLEEPIILYPIGDYGALEGYARFVDKNDHEGIVVQIMTPKGEPLPGMFTFTNSEGYYHFDMVPVGDYIA